MTGFLARLHGWNFDQPGTCARRWLTPTRLSGNLLYLEIIEPSTVRIGGSVERRRRM